MFTDSYPTTLRLNILFLFQDDGEKTDENIEKMLAGKARLVMCRICKGEHWTTKYIGPMHSPAPSPSPLPPLPLPSLCATIRGFKTLRC